MCADQRQKCKCENGRIIYGKMQYSNNKRMTFDDMIQWKTGIVDGDGEKMCDNSTFKDPHVGLNK